VTTRRRILTELVAYFQREGWSIENDEHGHIQAVMPSGGPAVIDLTELARHLHGR
jgi:hypothetical protein